MKRKLSLLIILFCVSSCATSRRMDRFLKEKSVSAKEDLRGDRVQGFPVFYKNGGMTSILWPLYDKDSKGVSVRPFYNREENEQAVLFPLTAWNSVEGDGWVGPYHWSKKHDALFPIYYRGDSYSHYLNYYKTENNQGLFPFYNYSKQGKFWCWWLYGMETTPESKRHQVLAGLLSHWEKKKDGDYTAYTFPYYTKKEGDKKTTVLAPLYHSSKSPNSQSRTILPLFHQFSRADGTGGFYTLLGGRSQSASKSMTMITPFYYSRKSPKASSKTLIPLFHQFSKSDGRSGVYTLLGGYTQKGDTSNWLIWPFYHAKKTPKAESKTLLPFFHQSSNAKGDERFYTLLGGYAKKDGNEGLTITPCWWSGKNGCQNYQLLFPFYYKSQFCQGERTWLFPWYSSQMQGESTQSLFPFYYRNQYAQNDRMWLFPWYSSTQGNETQQVLFPFMWRKTSPDKNQLSTWLSYYERSEGKKENKILPLYFSKEQGDKAYKHILPLYFSGKEKGKSYSSLLPFYYKEKAGERETLFTPLFSRSRDEKNAGFTNYFGPLYHHEFSDDYSFSSFLWPLTHFSKNGDDRYYNFAELYRYQKEADSTERSFLFRLAAKDDHGWRVTPLIGSDSDSQASTWNKLSLYHTERSDSGKRSSRFWPFYSYSENPKNTGFIYSSSLFTRFNTEARSSWKVTPLVGVDRKGDSEKLSLLPFYWQEKEGDQLSQAYYLAGLGSRDKHGWRMTPLMGSDYDSKASTWNKLSLYHTELDDAGKRSTRLWPLYSYSESEKANRFIYRSSLFSRIKTQQSSSWNITPLFGGQEVGENKKLTLFPLYWHDKKSDEITRSNAFGGLFGNDPDGWRLTPFISKRTKANNLLHEFNLVKVLQNKQESEYKLFPFYDYKARRNEQGALRSQSWSTPWLLPLVSHKKSTNYNQTSSLFGWLYNDEKRSSSQGELVSREVGSRPFYYHETNVKNGRKTETNNFLMGLLYHGSETKNKKGDLKEKKSMSFPWYYHSKTEKSESNYFLLSLLHYNQKSFDSDGEVMSESSGSFPFYSSSKTRKLDKKSILCGLIYHDEKVLDDKGKVKSRSMGSFPFYKQEMSGSDYDLSVLGFLAGYEKKGQDKRFRFPAILNMRGLIDVAENEHKSKANYCFLYSYEKTKEVKRRDIFPGIKWDSGKNESRFSFLWNFYESHEVDGRKGGHIFFIPWGS